MKEINYRGMRIVELFLEKLEQLNPKEREVITKTIDLLNHPLFLTEVRPDL